VTDIDFFLKVLLMLVQKWKLKTSGYALTIQIGRVRNTAIFYKILFQMSPTYGTELVDLFSFLKR
jgi:hypothetical protein